MLGKLYKHELHYLFKSLLPIYAATILFAALNRVIYFFDFENPILSIIAVLFTSVYVLTVVASFIICLVVVVVRFYRHLLSSEGYLTFTLPFTASQHIICKLLCATLMCIVSFISVTVTLLVFTVGTDGFKDFIEGLGEGLKNVFQIVPAGTIIAYVVLFVLLMIASIFQSLLMFYTSIAFGQKFKNRVGGAVLSYICIYVVVQIINSVLISIFSFLNPDGFMLNLNLTMDKAGLVLMAVYLIYISIYAVGYFLITRHLLSKKLNLE